MERRTFCGIATVTALAGCTEIAADFSDDQLGQTFSTDDGLELTVDEIETQTGGSVVLDEAEIGGGSDNITFVLPHLVATNPTGSRLSLPSFEEFMLQAGGRRYDTYRTDYIDEINNLSTSINEPVSGALFPPTDEIDSDEEAEGWLVFRTSSAGSSVVLEARLEDADMMEWTLQI